MLVHVAAEDDALRATATTSHQDIQMIAFLSIKLHSTSAAFGLASFLLHKGIER